MNEPPHCEPSEWDDIGKIYVSPERPIGRLSDYLDTLYEELFEVRTKVRFHEIVSQLVFHARHLTPAQHSILCFVLKSPFRPRRDKVQNPERDEDIRQAVRPGKSFLSFGHPLSCLRGQDLIDKIMERWGLNYDAAREAIKKAKRQNKAGMI